MIGCRANRMPRSGGWLGSGSKPVLARWRWSPVRAAHLLWRLRVTERKLRARGWECFEPPGQQLPEEVFDCITCMNVLDRADAPLSLLESLRVRLKPETGRLILAVVLVSGLFCFTFYIVVCFLLALVLASLLVDSLWGVSNNVFGMNTGIQCS